MNSIGLAAAVLGFGLALGFVLPPSRADEGSASDGLANPMREVMLPFRELTLDPTMRVTEGPRMLGDLFPYLAGARRDAPSARKVEIVPEKLGSFLPAVPGEEGKPPVRIRSGAAAIEAVRLFLAGPIVTDEATANRLIATGRRLEAEMEHLEVKITDHRPGSFAPRADAAQRHAGGDRHEAWDVSIVALELDRMLRLVHVTARVTTEGAVTLERTPIVDGPMTSWQTAADGTWTDEMQRREDAMHAEAIAARRVYAKALRPARTLDAFWAAGRVLHDMDDIRALFGKPDRDIGSGIHIWTYDLTDGTSVVFGGSAGRVVYVRHVRGAKRPMHGFETIGTIYAGPGR